MSAIQTISGSFGANLLRQAARAGISAEPVVKDSTLSVKVGGGVDDNMLWQLAWGQIRQTLDDAFADSGISGFLRNKYEALQEPSTDLFGMALQYGSRRMGPPTALQYAGLSPLMALGAALDEGFANAMATLDSLGGNPEIRQSLADSRLKLQRDWQNQVSSLLIAGASGASFGFAR
ncbi:hypothetical protein [Shewanella sp. GXUN23E]|uniref:hypothetical protein n=1 Tax=Shewanella sp. GXUN23E TaxID=3422498 RepID=UPI003D7E84EF